MQGEGWGHRFRGTAGATKVNEPEHHRVNDWATAQTPGQLRGTHRDTTAQRAEFTLGDGAPNCTGVQA